MYNRCLLSFYAEMDKLLTPLQMAALSTASLDEDLLHEKTVDKASFLAVQYECPMTKKVSFQST